MNRRTRPQYGRVKSRMFDFPCFLRLFLKKRKKSLSCFPQPSSGHRQEVEVCAGKHGIQPILVFPQAPVPGFPVSKLAFPLCFLVPATIFHVAQCLPLHIPPHFFLLHGPALSRDSLTKIRRENAEFFPFSRRSPFLFPKLMS